MIISNFTFSKLKFLHPHLAKFQISVGVNTIHPIVQYLKPVLPLPFFSYTVVNLSNPTSYTCRIYFKPDHFLPPLLPDAPSKIHRNYCKSLPIFHSLLWFSIKIAKLVLLKRKSEYVTATFNGFPTLSD